MRNHDSTGRLRPLVVLSGMLLGVAMAGCFDAPSIEDRWTRLDFREIAWASEAAPALRVRGTVTFRTIQTATVAAEVRISDTLTPSDVRLDPEDNRLDMALSVERVLANSVSVARETRLVTGFDHLIVPLDFDLTVSRSPEREEMAFVLLYLGEAEEMEQPDGTDTLIVTPLDSEDEILAAGAILSPPMERSR